MKTGDSTARSGVQRLLADAGHTLGSSLFLLVLGMATSVILARWLGPEGKGAYDLLWTTGYMFSVLGGLSLSSGITFYAARGEAGGGRLLPVLGLYAAFLSAVVGGLLLLVRDTPSRGLFLPAGAGLPAITGIVLLVGLLASTEHWRSMAVGLGRIAKANRRDVVREVSFVALLLLIALSGTGGVSLAPYTWAIWAAVGAQLLGALLLLRVVRGSDRGPRQVGFGSILRYSAPAHTSNVAQALNYRLDFFLVSYFAGVTALGLYSIAVGLAQLLWVASRAASRVLLPAVASNAGASEELTAMLARLSLWTAAAGAVCYVIVGQPLIQLLYGADFLPGYAPLVILLAGTVPFTLSNTLAAHLGGLGLQVLNLRASLVGLALTVALDLAWIPRFGITGAAAATSVSYLATTGILIHAFLRRSTMGLSDLILLRRTDLGVAAAVARGALAALVGRTSS
jgi:O-antigen/teichoic acid export membrane protein